MKWLTSGVHVGILYKGIERVLPITVVVCLWPGAQVPDLDAHFLQCPDDGTGHLQEASVFVVGGVKEGHFPPAEGQKDGRHRLRDLRIRRSCPGEGRIELLVRSLLVGAEL